MAQDGKCKFCDKDGKLVDAHIIPKAFYRKEGDHPFMVVNATRAERPSRSQKGLWDDGILCDFCEERFAPLDAYAVENLQQRRADALPVVLNGRILLDRNGGPLALALPWVSAEQIMQFALFVLWRAGASTRDECAAVELDRSLRRFAISCIRASLRALGSMSHSGGNVIPRSRG
jgi:hypothetical protein